MKKQAPFPSPGFDEDPEGEELVPDWHWQVIEDRLAAHREHPERVVAWEEAGDAIRTKLRERIEGRSADAGLLGKLPHKLPARDVCLLNVLFLCHRREEDIVLF